MAASREGLELWFNMGLGGGWKRMIVWCDTYDFEDYPEYTDTTGQDLREYTSSENGKNMKKLMEVYDLTAPLEPQMAERRAFNY